MSRKKTSFLIGTREDVKSLQDDLRKLGFTVRDKSGIFGKTTKSAVVRFQKENLTDATGIPDFETIYAIKKATEAFAYVIKGAVISHSRVGVGGLRVEIVDRNVGDYIPVAESITDENGEYIANFNLNALRQRGKQKLDLQARVFTNKTLLGVSDVRYNASNHETLNIFLAEKADSALPSEYESLTRTLKASFPDNLRDLKEKDDRKDITYLANKTGWDARAVALAALADRFSVSTSYGNAARRIEPAFFYALFRSGLSANENSLYRTDSKTVEALWIQSIKQGLIPANLKKKIPSALRAFKNVSAKIILDGPPLVGLSTLLAKG